MECKQKISQTIIQYKKIGSNKINKSTFISKKLGQYMNRRYLEASNKVMEMFLEDMLKSRVCKEHKQITEHGNPFFLLILQQEIISISTVNAHLNQIIEATKSLTTH